MTKPDETTNPYQAPRGTQSTRTFSQRIRRATWRAWQTYWKGMKRDGISIFQQLRAFLALAISVLFVVMLVFAFVWFFFVEAGWVQ